MLRTSSNGQLNMAPRLFSARIIVTGGRSKQDVGDARSTPLQALSLPLMRLVVSICRILASGVRPRRPLFGGHGSQPARAGLEMLWQALASGLVRMWGRTYFASSGQTSSTTSSIKDNCMFQFALGPTHKHYSLFTIAGIAIVLSALLSPGALAEDDVRSEGASITDSRRPALSVTTLNMAKEKDSERILREWRAHPGIWNSDSILLQEVAQFGGERSSIAQTLATQMGRYVISVPNVPDGLAIISRYPLTDFEVKQLDHNSMVFHTRNRIMVGATVQTPFGPLRVYNIHLDSRINSQARLRQIAPVISEAAQWDGPCLIGGDFNTNCFRWAGNVLPIGVFSQARAIQRAMSARGFTTVLSRTGPTSDFLRLRLDWFYTREIQVFDAAIEPIEFSDHHAVRITLTPNA